MKLREYLDKNGVTCERLSLACGCSTRTIISAAKGYEISLTNAIKIEEATHGVVKCIDLKPTIIRGKTSDKESGARSKLSKRSKPSQRFPR